MICAPTRKCVAESAIISRILPGSNAGELTRASRWVYQDRKSTRLNSSHANISYAVFCLKKKKKRHELRESITHQGFCYQKQHSETRPSGVGASRAVATNDLLMFISAEREVHSQSQRIGS